MHCIRVVLMTAALWSWAAAALGQMLPRIPEPMHHVGIHLHGTEVSIHAPEPAVPGGVLPLYNYGESYDAAADALNGLAYNDQFGFMLHGIVSLPAETAFWFKQVNKSPGLQIHQGGMRANRANHSYQAILETPGDTWTWNGSMAHHWFAVADPGAYETTLEVYVGDAVSGLPDPGFTPAQTTLRFVYVPEPAAGIIGLVGAALLVGRRGRINGGIGRC
ncbi:MAG: hypothetical protein AMXMBFR13_25220 [Phycisphaerae bacterium]